MDVIEKAIRNAFDKGNPEDRAFREKVYRSAFAALDRALQANPKVTLEAAIARRKGLQGKITEIESEYLPAMPAGERRSPASAAPPAPATPADAVRADPPLAAPIAAQEPPNEPGLDWPSAGNDAADPGHATPVVPNLDFEHDFAAAPVLDRAAGRAAPERLAGDGPPMTPAAETRPVERKRSYAAMFFGVTLLTAAGIGLWWALQTGLLKTPAERDTSVPNPPAAAESEDFIPEAEAPAVRPGQPEADRAWITVFSPANADQVTTPADAKAEMMQDDTGNFLRIRSGAEGAGVIFDIGQGTLEQLAGKTAMFDIVARAEEGQETEMAVDCNFGELGDCGRKRYAVGYERGDYLFEVAFPNAPPGAAGTIAINSDFANQGRGVDIYEIRVSVAP